MIELIFTVCLMTSPTTCATKTMQFADVSVMACMTSAQPHLAAWTNEHPDWQVRRWNCQTRRPDRSL